MRNRTNSSTGPGSWLAALARRLRDWLNHYLGEGENLAVEGDRPESPQEGLDPLEHWLALVRNAAPELLIAPEEGGAPWLYAGQVQDAGNPEETILPENQAAETSGPMTILPRGPQQAKGKEKEKMSPPVEQRPDAAAEVPQPGPRTTNQPADRQSDQNTNALSQTDERRRYAGSRSRVDTTKITTNEATHVPQPFLKSTFEVKETGSQGDRMTKEISPRELPIQASVQPDVAKKTGRQMDWMTKEIPSPKELSIQASVQPDLARDSGAARPKSVSFTALQAPPRSSNRVPELVRGSNRNQTVERQRNLNLDSASALSGHHVVANQPSRQKQPPSLSLQGKPLLRQPEFNEAGTWPVLPKSGQHGIEPLPPVRQQPHTAESTGDRRPLFTRSAGDSPVVVSNLKAESPSNLWPELPEWPLLEDIDDTQFVRDLQHAQALDLEQGGF